MMAEQSRERPLTIAILALGGQGGGVLTGWLVETAKANGYIAQSTFVAGVAQRTGATVYCVEMFRNNERRRSANSRCLPLTRFPAMSTSSWPARWRNPAGLFKKALSHQT